MDGLNGKGKRKGWWKKRKILVDYSITSQNPRYPIVNYGVRKCKSEFHHLEPDQRLTSTHHRKSTPRKLRNSSIGSSVKWYIMVRHRGSKVPPPSSFSRQLPPLPPCFQLRSFLVSFLHSPGKISDEEERGWWYVHRGKGIYFLAFGSEIEVSGEKDHTFLPCLPLVDRWQIGAANFISLHKFQTTRELGGDDSISSRVLFLTILIG